MNYWWVNANPSKWDVGSTPENQKLFNVTGTDWVSDYWRKANHSEAKEGDIAICYKTDNIQKIVAIGRIKFVHRTDDGKVQGCYIEVIHKLHHPTISKEQLGNEYPDLGINNQSFTPGTMFKLTQVQGLMLIGLTIISEEE